MRTLRPSSTGIDDNDVHRLTRGDLNKSGPGEARNAHYPQSSDASGDVTPSRRNGAQTPPIDTSRSCGSLAAEIFR